MWPSVSIVAIPDPFSPLKRRPKRTPKPTKSWMGRQLDFCNPSLTKHLFFGSWTPRHRARKRLLFCFLLGIPFWTPFFTCLKACVAILSNPGCPKDPGQGGPLLMLGAFLAPWWTPWAMKLPLGAPGPRVPTSPNGLKSQKHAHFTQRCQT